jgi:hypothetical protein
MNLQLMCDTAICNVKLAHIEADLEQYTTALGYATYEMQAFDILINKVEELNKEKARLLGKLKQLR